MKIKVTQKDIDAGECGSAGACPIALAIIRALRTKLVEVGVFDVTIKGKDHPLPWEAGEFIVDFDYRRPVKPFTFEL